MKSSITIIHAPNGYRLTVSGRFGGGYDRSVNSSPAEMAGILRREIGRYIATNPDGGDYYAPTEVIEAMEQGTVDGLPTTGQRISYYASPEALQAIQSEREATGNSQSGAINAIVMRDKKYLTNPKRL